MTNLTSRAIALFGFVIVIIAALYYFTGRPKLNALFAIMAMGIGIVVISTAGNSNKTN